MVIVGLEASGFWNSPTRGLWRDCWIAIFCRETSYINPNRQATKPPGETSNTIDLSTKSILKCLLHLDAFWNPFSFFGNSWEIFQVCDSLYLLQELGMVLVGCRCLTQVQPFECHLEDLSLKIFPSHFEPSLAPIFSAMNFCASQGAC